MTDYVSVPSGRYGLTLGEGPLWNPGTGELSIIDIFDKTVYRFEVRGTELTEVGSFRTEGDVGAALPLEDGHFLTCERGGVFVRDIDGTGHRVADLPVSGSDMRFNDGKLGPDGHLWVGVMDDEATEGRGSLWRISAHGDAQCLLDGLTIPNGMDWWGDEFWFVNGPTEEIRCYRFDSRGIEPTDRRITTRGTPDGLVIDTEGFLWLALWGEGRVDRYRPDGAVLDTVSVASPHSTSLSFAGDDLTTLVMTSARFAMSDEALAATPHAGDLFTVSVEATGRLPNRRFG